MESGNLGDLWTKVAEIEARVSKLEQLQSVKGSKIEDFSMNSDKKLSIREFINLINPKNNVEIVLAIAYYKEIVQLITPFTVKDIEGGFKEAKEPAPENVNLPIFYNVKKGYLMENNSPDTKLKSWELTNTGIKIVEERESENKK